MAQFGSIEDFREARDEMKMSLSVNTIPFSFPTCIWYLRTINNDLT